MSVVTTELRSDGMALVRIDNPPVNALSQAVRQGLMKAVKTVSRSEAKAAILICKGRTFIAGADIREFNQPPKEPFLGDVIKAIEASPVPWIAAIHGNALGGGLETALGCAARIASPSAKLGLPEVNLGLLPGAGGTVRLPRLIDPVEALKLIVSGKPAAASKALELGLIDAISDGDLLDGAVSYAQTLLNTGRPKPLCEKPVTSQPSEETWNKTLNGLLRRRKGEIAPERAADQIWSGLSLEFEDALKREVQCFLKLKTGEQSAALRHIFFAERSAVGRADLKEIEPRSLNAIAIIGAGTMGQGIAAACLLNGLDVVLLDRDAASVDAGKAGILKTLTQSEARGMITSEQRSAMESALSTAINFDALAHCDLIIEAVFEEMSVKQAVFAELDKIAPDAILASNTSYLDINQIAEPVHDKSRVIGLHFFSPAHIMKLVEVIHTDHASPETLATGFALAKRLKKLGVSSSVCDGFIGNRVMSAYRRECEFMLEDGAMPWDIDQAMKTFGFPMGLFEMQDLAGLDIGWARRKAAAPSREPSERYVAIADKICELGHYGRKTGQGWYDYRTDPPKPASYVEDIILAEADRKVITRRPFKEAEIIERILTAMQSEGAAILEEGVAQSPEAIDVVMVNGFAFPRWRGGPMFMRVVSDSF